MTDKEVRKLRKSDLLEMLLEAEKEINELNQENKRLREQLEDKKIKISMAGSIAEAALVLNGVFEAAQKAISQYEENICRQNDIRESEVQNPDEDVQESIEDILAELEAING